MSLTVYDYRDLDLMMVLHAQTSLTSPDLADAIGLKDGSRHVGIRLAWMQRFGMTKLDSKTRLWALSPGGERVVESKRRAAAHRQIQDIPDEALIDAMASITNRYQHGDSMTAALLRREFQFGTSPRRR
jgi:hypothetical protein